MDLWGDATQMGKGGILVSEDRQGVELAMPQEVTAFTRRGRLANAVVEHLANAIVTEAYPIGSALPTETVLCDMYKVSRTVIREVSTTLAEKGLIVSQQGRGTIVQDQSHWNLLDSVVLAALFRRKDGLAYLDSLIEIRLLLECDMTRRAVEHMTGGALNRLETLLSEMAALTDRPADYSLADVRFHDEIMALSGNLLGRAIINGIQGQAITARDYNGEPTFADIAETHRDHEAIMTAIRAHDPKKASRAMYEHISRSWHHRRRT